MRKCKTERRSYRRQKDTTLTQSEAPTLIRKRRRRPPLLFSTCKFVGDDIAGEIAGDYFEWIPDDIILTILSKLSLTASGPPDFINAILSCKKFGNLCFTPFVLSKVSLNILAMKAKNWSDGAQRFLLRCSVAGNLNACYILGMIRFYCLGKRSSGLELIARAAAGVHAAAFYSLAIIHFNGSGSSKKQKDLQTGVAFCARGASLGNLNALRELGHCLQDGYGVCQNIVLGRRCLIHVYYKELTGKVKEEIHPVNVFMADWFEERMGVLQKEELRLCSYKGCGRPETRTYEFRRCSLCGSVNYCSRACQAKDWRVSHKMKCTAGLVRLRIPEEILVVAGDDGGAVAVERA